MTEKKQQELTMKFLHQLANELMFELDDEQCHNLWLEFDAIEKQMEIVRKIDTGNIAPLAYPFTFTNQFLRKDIIENSLETRAILENAPLSQEQYIVINKVVNDEN